MKYQKFEDLPVWKAAIELGRQMYTLTEHPALENRYSLRDQIERASVSVSNNLAEGFDRGTNQELLTFLYIARGSAAEVRSMLYLLEGMTAFSNLESEMRNLRATTESISKQLGAWIQSILNSSLKGQRYVTEKVKKADQARGERDEFLARLEKIRRGEITPPDKA
jgi:four helix bundle protein